MAAGDDYDKMAKQRAKWARDAERDRRAASRRSDSEHFPANSPAIERAQKQLVERAAEESAARIARMEVRFTSAEPCGWCTRVRVNPPGLGEIAGTALFVVQPAKYEGNPPRLVKPAIYARACIDCARARGLIHDAKAVVEQREKTRAENRAEQSKEDKAAQLGIFADERLNTDPIRNG